MGIFKSKEEKNLIEILARVDMAMANNYKDDAQENFALFERSLESYKGRNALKPKILEKYEQTAESYRSRLKGYTHKDQKPFWTKN